MNRGQILGCILFFLEQCDMRKLKCVLAFLEGLTGRMEKYRDGSIPH